MDKDKQKSNKIKNFIILVIMLMLFTNISNGGDSLNIY